MKLSSLKTNSLFFRFIFVFFEIFHFQKFENFWIWILSLFRPTVWSLGAKDLRPPGCHFVVCFIAIALQSRRCWQVDPGSPENVIHRAGAEQTLITPFNWEFMADMSGPKEGPGRKEPGARRWLIYSWDGQWKGRQLLGRQATRDDPSRSPPTVNLCLRPPSTSKDKQIIPL